MSSKHPHASASGNRRKSVFTATTSNAALNEAAAAQALELERIEQEITFTLQDIDKSFAKSHRIVNDRLIPIVKRYHDNSTQIRSGLSFWKTFLEASANVELRGYEEAVQQQNDLDNDLDDGSREVVNNAEGGSVSDQGPSEQDTEKINERLSPVKSVGIQRLKDPIEESTDHTAQQIQTRYAHNFPGKTNANVKNVSKDNPIMPQTKSKNAFEFDTTDSILPQVPVTANFCNSAADGTDLSVPTPSLQSNLDATGRYLVYNNLDTDYKVEVTPKKRSKSSIGVVQSVTPKKPAQKKRKSIYAERFDSSPELPTPKLNSGIEFSPVKGERLTPLRNNRDGGEEHQQQDGNETQRFPNTVRYGAGGNLLRTPGQVNQTANRYSGNNFKIGSNQKKDVNTTNNDLLLDDSEEGPRISPPTTIKFSTEEVRETTRQAAQTIVKDLLAEMSVTNDSTELEVPTLNEKESTSKYKQGKSDANVLEGEGLDSYLDAKPERSKDMEPNWSD